jgi:protein-S-isoprenylcysteine O-methyltransferase Ste14
MSIRSLELKIPPPVVTLMFGILMWLVAPLAAPFALSAGIRVMVALVVAAIAVAIALTAVVSFARTKTTVNPIKPETASSLVVRGIFRYTRNPMYLGMLLCLLAWTVYLASWPALLCLPLFVLYMNEFQIKPEEKALSSLFGAEYDAYRAQVRRWL